MIRRFLLVLLLAASPVFLMAQAGQADDVAHGSEKVAHEAAHPNQDHGGEEGAPKFLGQPAWIFKLVNTLLFIGVLVYFVGGPVKRALADRHSGIQRAASRSAVTLPARAIAAYRVSDSGERVYVNARSTVPGGSFLTPARASRM